MKTLFIHKEFNPGALEIIETCVRIIERYEEQGYTLTLRQLYYQCIAADTLPDEWKDSVTKSKNNEKSYKKLGGIIADARLAGLIDWNMIEDRGRSTSSPSHWDTPKHLLEAAARAFSRDKWRNQPNYVEVMVEKQALEGVLEPVCRRLGIPFTSNKGYSSATCMFDAGQRLKEQFARRALERGLIPRSRQRHALADLGRDEIERIVEAEESSEGRPLFRLSEKGISRQDGRGSP